MKRRLTDVERATRLEQRAARRQAAADRVANLRDWHQTRATNAAKAARKRAKKLRKRARGVDRVPAHLQGLARTVEAVEVGKHGTKLAQPHDLHPAGNHAQRRARGQRGKPRKRRLREMPRAEARRLERAQREWLS